MENKRTMIASSKSSIEYERATVGMHNAICSAVHDLGFQKNNYMGEEKILHKIIIQFELEQKYSYGDNAGQPILISKEYTFSFGDKANLKKDLVSWRGKAFFEKTINGMVTLYSDSAYTKPFDLIKLIGIKATLNIIEHNSKNGKTYIVIGGINPAMKDNNLTVINLDYVPEFIQKKINEQIAMENLSNVEDEYDVVDDGFNNDDDVPF